MIWDVKSVVKPKSTSATTTTTTTTTITNFYQLLKNVSCTLESKLMIKYAVEKYKKVQEKGIMGRVK